MSLGKIKEAVAEGDRLHKLDDLPPGFRTLATLYKGEANAILGQHSEAQGLLELNKNCVVDMSFKDPSYSSDTATGTNANVPINSDAVCSSTAKSVFQTNLAIASFIRGDVAKAEEILDKLAIEEAKSGAKNSSVNKIGGLGLSGKILNLRLHVALSKGNVGKAKDLASKYRTYEKEVPDF